MIVSETEAKDIISDQGWTPRILSRRNGLQYIYAAKRQNKKVLWRYIGPVSKLQTMTREEILSHLASVAS